MTVGVSVCVFSKEDVVVGAPFHHVGGAIYIYYNSAQVTHMASLLSIMGV